MPQLDRYGYIPACAGETQDAGFLAIASVGYIPACAGETRIPGYSFRDAVDGTSPRVRGKPASVARPTGTRRPFRYIPACAGETDANGRPGTSPPPLSRLQWLPC